MWFSRRTLKSNVPATFLSISILMGYIWQHLLLKLTAHFSHRFLCNSISSICSATFSLDPFFFKNFVQKNVTLCLFYYYIHRLGCQDLSLFVFLPLSNSIAEKLPSWNPPSKPHSTVPCFQTGIQQWKVERYSSQRNPDRTNVPKCTTSFKPFLKSNSFLITSFGMISAIKVSFGGLLSEKGIERKYLIFFQLKVICFVRTALTSH